MKASIKTSMNIKSNTKVTPAINTNLLPQINQTALNKNP